MKRAKLMLSNTFSWFCFIVTGQCSEVPHCACKVVYIERNHEGTGSVYRHCGWCNKTRVILRENWSLFENAVQHEKATLPFRDWGFEVLKFVHVVEYHARKQITWICISVLGC